MDDLLSRFRDATEDDVALALDRALIELPLKQPAELLEFFNRMVDVLTGEDDEAEFVDELNIRDAGDQPS